MKNSKILALALAIMLVFSLLAGCAGDADTSTAPSTTPTGGSNTSSTPPSNETDEPQAGILPIVTDAITLTVFANPLTFSQRYVTASDMPIYKKLAELTNVTLEFHHAGADGAEVAFNLMVASGIYDDILAMSSQVTKLQYYVDNEITLDMTDYVNNEMPNYKAYLDGDERLNKDVKTDAGNYAAVYDLLDEPNIKWGGYVFRQDIMNDLGISSPLETYGDWYDVLSAMKQGGVEYPLALSMSGYDYFNLLPGGYGVGSGLFVSDGKAKYGPAEDGFKSYLEMLNKWYTEGLIDPDFYTRARGLWPETSISYAENRTGAFFGSYGTMGDYVASMGLTDDPDYFLMGVQAPVVERGGQNNFNLADVRYGSCPWAISVTNPYPLETAHYLDYYFSEDALDLINYGIEGESLIYVNGVPQYSELVTNDSEGIEFNTAVCAYIVRDFININIAKRNNSILNDEAIRSIELWAKFPATAVIPNIALTPEESSERSALLNDIQTYVSECLNTFITGTKSLDEWDSYVAQIEGMGLGRVLEITNGALDRYNSR